MKLSIGIKALNEEKNVARCIESAVRSASQFDGEVLLADCGSSDKTVDIARNYPIKVFQLSNFAERSCGAGAQLAYQFSAGDYFYILDGDMVLSPEFIVEAIEYLDCNPDVAGVGGLVTERHTESIEFQIRAKGSKSEKHRNAGYVDRLDMGGLYRSAAIRDVGYFADRNLHAFEEFDLAARLRSRGWKLARVGRHAVDHFGHQAQGYRLLMRRWRSGYMSAIGILLKSAIGKKRLRIVLRSFSHLRNAAIISIWWLLTLATAIAPLDVPYRLSLTFFIVLAPLAFLCWRRGSFAQGLYSLFAWNLLAIGTIRGLFGKRVSPDIAIAANRLH